MGIDIQTETLISFAVAAKRLPRSDRGKAVHAKTVARWALHGLGGIKLEMIAIGERHMTSVEACKRFFAALTARANNNPAPAPAPPASRKADVRGRLKALGLKK